LEQVSRGRVEVKLAGIGGQGVVLASHVLALGAFYDGKWVVCTQAYSARVRGGPVEADVIISEHKIGYPFVRRPNILVVLAEPGLKFVSSLAKGGLLLADASLSSEVEAYEVNKLVLPFFEVAKGECGSPSVANMVALGALVGHTGLVSKGAVEKAIGDSVSRAYLDLDLRAFRAGLRLVGE